MCGDQRLIGDGAFIMIHNAWVYGVGNRHDFRDLADYLEPFDASLRDIYVGRTAQKAADIETWMDEETFLNSSRAIELGFATGTISKTDLTEDVETSNQARALNAARKVENLLTRKGGMTRTEARALLKELKSGKPGAAANLGTSRALSPRPSRKLTTPQRSSQPRAADGPETLIPAARTKMSHLNSRRQAGTTPRALIGTARADTNLVAMLEKISASVESQKADAKAISRTSRRPSPTSRRRMTAPSPTSSPARPMWSPTRRWTASTMPSIAP